MYAASRNLYALAITGNAPKIFAKCSKRGIPYYAVTAVFLADCLSFLVVSNKSIQVFNWFMNITTLSSLFNWFTLFLATLRFRKAYMSHGLTRFDLPFSSPFMPYAAYYGLGMVTFFVLISGFDSLFPPFDPKTFVADYIGVLIFTVPWISHKLYRTMKGEGWWMRDPKDIDIFTGKAEVDEYERNNPAPVAKNLWEKRWFKIA
jgi:amino acid transporter